MKPLSPATVVLRAALLLFLAWLYVGDLVRWGQAQAAEVAALADLPHLGLSLAGTAVVLFGFGVLGLAALQKRPARWAPQRLLSVAIVVLVFFDFVVLSSNKGFFTAEERAQLAIDSLAQLASDNSGSEAVLRDPAMLQAMAADLGPAPYFQQGERVSGWRVELRERCAGPAEDARDAAVGTLIYCVASDFKRAWITLVGTPAGRTFGPRAVVSAAPAWVGEVHAAPPPEREQDAPPEQPVWDSPTPEAGP